VVALIVFLGHWDGPSLLAGRPSLAVSAILRRFLFFSDIPIFSRVVNGLTVKSTVNFGGLNRLVAGFHEGEEGGKL